MLQHQIFMRRNAFAGIIENRTIVFIQLSKFYSIVYNRNSINSMKIYF